MKTRRAALVLPGALMGVLSASTVHAFEDQWHLGAGIGGVNVTVDAIGLGAGVNAFAAYGLSDMFDLKLDLVASSHPLNLDGVEQRGTIFDACLGLSYKIDIIEWIPYFGVQAGYLTHDMPEGIGLAANDLILGGMLGIDYAFSRSFGAGLMNRLHVPLGGGTVVDLFLRFEYRPGF